MTAPEQRPNRPLAIHPRLLTIAVTVLHILATVLVLYELDLQHYQTAKKQLVTENFDDYLTLPTESLKELALEALYNPFPSGRARALTELHATVDNLLRDPATPVFRFTLRSPEGQVLLDRNDPHKPARLENWRNRLFLSGFTGFVDMRLPRSTFHQTGETTAVARLQAYYGSPVDKQAVTDLTLYHRRNAGLILIISILLYAVFYRTLLRPMESVSLRLEASRTTPPHLIPCAGSVLESGYNRMALQALLQQLDQILAPLLRPALPPDEVFPTVRQAMDFVRQHFPAEAVLVARLTATGSEPHILELHITPNDKDPSPQLRRTLLDDDSPQTQPPSSAQPTFVRATLPLVGQDLVSLITIPDNYPDPALARSAASAAAATILRPIAAAAAMHQELFRQSREANIVLSRNLGHDLTNIIATAKLDLAVLRRLLTDDPATLPPRKSELIRTSVGALLDTTRFLQEVVNIYRAFSFLKRPIREPADINELLTTFVAAFRPSVSARVHIQLHLPTEPVRATVEIRLLKLALFNLVQNALDAIKRLPTGPEPEPAEILLNLIPPTTHADPFQITIEDNGPGICGQDGQPLNPAAIPAIFGFGYSTKDREVNEGLGLAWVRTIIEEFHGGTIRAENRTPHGARFIITLPVEGPD